MQLRHLQHFVGIVEEMTSAPAARRVCITQPALSRGLWNATAYARRPPMIMRLLLVTLTLAVSSCASRPSDDSLGQPWPRSGASIHDRVRAEILDLYARYAMYADASAGEAYATLFAENGEIVMGSLRITGRPALARRISSKGNQTIHLQGSPVLVQLSADRMVAHTPVILGVRANHVSSGPGRPEPPTFSFSFYDDELVRTSSGWRFIRRVARPAPALTQDLLKSAEDRR